jgi:hypothetical protein
MKTCMLQAGVQFMKEARLPCSLIHPLTTHTAPIGVLATLLALVPSMAVALGLQGSQDLEVNIMVVVIHAVNHG